MREGCRPRNSAKTLEQSSIPGGSATGAPREAMLPTTEQAGAVQYGGRLKRISSVTVTRPLTARQSFRRGVQYVGVRIYIRAAGLEVEEGNS